MATNKHAQIRYIALDKCFSNFGRKFYIEDLIIACNEAIYDFTGKHEGVKKRQIYEDMKYMESAQGWHIELERLKEGRKTYHRYADKSYSINKSPLSTIEVNQINEVLLTLSRFKGMPQFEWIDDIASRLESISKIDENKIIDFEQNQFLKGLEFITPLFNAIYYKRVLRVQYQSFKDEKIVTHIIHPYYLKQYNLRWFLFGLNSVSKYVNNLALDRIVSLTEIPEIFEQNKAIDFNEYFDDVIGVTIPNDKTIETIQILVLHNLWPYIKTKPIHGSQKKVEENDQGVYIELQVIPNYELIASLLAYGENIIIISPESFRLNFLKKIHAMEKNYG
ncbi:WYL domain-containing protein [Pedobacter sp. PLR]|uniref:helix-turn-helix transcriptional regulator n=1 Tax=Pedobacter sp. PLR TaxID=2994465 RepID=UPI002246CB7D|nr:WYL domain-containing protein [Pedobacter sp. PLR]MCX2450036.1 WYL domain-containing protein [Pedobacter sp. PLR]